VELGICPAGGSPFVVWQALLWPREPREQPALESLASTLVRRGGIVIKTSKLQCLPISPLLVPDEGEDEVEEFVHGGGEFFFNSGEVFF